MDNVLVDTDAVLDVFKTKTQATTKRVIGACQRRLRAYRDARSE